MTRTLKLEFAGETPSHVYIGSVRYQVGEYTPEVIQCFNCQNFGHITKHCHASPVCVFCGVRGHRVKERKCRVTRPRCYNCKEEHTSSYKGCIAYRREKIAQQVKLDQRLNIHESRKMTDKYIDKYPELIRKPRNSSYPETNTSQGRPWSQVVAGRQNVHQVSEDVDAQQPSRRPQSQSAIESSVTSLIKDTRPPPIEGERWEQPAPIEEERRRLPAPIEEPRPQRVRTRENSTGRDRRISTTESIGTIENPNYVMSQDILDDIRGVVQESIKDMLTKVLQGFATLMISTVYAHSISEEGKQKLIKDGIEDLCKDITEKLPQEWTQQKKRRRHGNSQEREPPAKKRNKMKHTAERK